MIAIETAGLRIRIDNRYERTATYCADFLIPPDGEDWDLEIEVREEDVESERLRSEPQRFSRGYLETVTLLRLIANRISRFDAYLMHAATVAVDGRAYAFLAPSGTGKSTHVGLWKEMLGERMVYVNGDKPFVRKQDGRFLVAGSPWRGKEGYGGRVVAPLCGICILRRGEVNEIRRLTPKEASEAFLKQVHLPPDLLSAMEVLTLADETLRTVPVWELHCNISPEAAALSFETMSGGGLPLDARENGGGGNG